MQLFYHIIVFRVWNIKEELEDTVKKMKLQKYLTQMLLFSSNFVQIILTQDNRILDWTHIMIWNLVK